MTRTQEQIGAKGRRDEGTKTAAAEDGALLRNAQGTTYRWFTIRIPIADPFPAAERSCRFDGHAIGSQAFVFKRIKAAYGCHENGDDIRALRHLLGEIAKQVGESNGVGT